MGTDIETFAEVRDRGGPWRLAVDAFENEYHDAMQHQALQQQIEKLLTLEGAAQPALLETYLRQQLRSLRIRCARTAPRCCSPWQSRNYTLFTALAGVRVILGMTSMGEYAPGCDGLPDDVAEQTRLFLSDCVIVASCTRSLRQLLAYDWQGGSPGWRNCGTPHARLRYFCDLALPAMLALLIDPGRARAFVADIVGDDDRTGNKSLLGVLDDYLKDHAPGDLDDVRMLCCFDQL